MLDGHGSHFQPDSILTLASTGVSVICLPTSSNRTNKGPAIVYRSNRLKHEGVWPYDSLKVGIHVRTERSSLTIALDDHSVTVAVALANWSAG